MATKRVELDVRPDITAGREPFGRIMAAVKALKANQVLALIAPFEPRPLYNVLAGHGLEHSAKLRADGAWEIVFSREPTQKPSTNPAGIRTDESSACEMEVVSLDVRGLEPPEPMVQILEAASRLRKGTRLLARTDRRPVHLYPILEERGFEVQTQEAPDGGVILQVHNANTR